MPDACPRSPGGLVAVTLLLLAAVLPAQRATVAMPGVPPDAFAPDGRRLCRIGRVAPQAAPRIDGALDDTCWQHAPEIGPLVMVEPFEGRRPPQDTVVKVLHDRNYLYFAIWCHDDDPSSIRATQRQRDARLDPDDRVEILLDTFENRRTGYFFQIGAGGSIGDGLAAANGTRFDKPWDVIFDGRSRITPDGWQAELAIPFRSIPRRRGASTWGFNLRRHKRSAGEEYQWANPVQAVPFFRISELGTMAGIGEVSDGIGVDVVPYVAARFERDRLAAGGEGDDWTFDPDAGGDVFYRLTPELTLAATLFTDFAQTENDNRQINLNRFPLFFPEKRDFFLEGAGYFSFGSGQRDVLPFFSRRIGLDAAGQPIPLLAGLKLIGEAGPWGIGALDAVTDAGGTVDERKNLAVARVRYALDEQTAAGVIATSGHPTEPVDNQVWGADLYHREPEFVGDLDLQLFLSALGSHTSGDGGGSGQDWSLRAQSQGREWQAEVDARWTSPDFDPALGFVRRPGVHRYQASTGYNPRLGEGTWRNLTFELGVDYVEGWDGGKQDLGFTLDWLGARTVAGDRFRLGVARRFERVPADFRLFDDTVTIFAGDYWTTRHSLEVASHDGRPVDAALNLSHGDFFDGESTQVALDVNGRLGALLQLGAAYRTALVDLPLDRDFTTRIAEASLDLHFDAWVSLLNLVQYDNESDLLGWQTRLRWILRPGSDLFAVVGAAWLQQPDRSLVPTDQSLVLKLTHTLRF